MKAKREQYLTPEEASVLLRVHIVTVRNWCRTRKIKAVKFGHTWRIPQPVTAPKS